MVACSPHILNPTAPKPTRYPEGAHFFAAYHNPEPHVKRHPMRKTESTPFVGYLLSADHGNKLAGVEGMKSRR